MEFLMSNMALFFAHTSQYHQLIKLVFFVWARARGTDLFDALWVNSINGQVSHRNDIYDQQSIMTIVLTSNPVL